MRTSRIWHLLSGTLVIPLEEMLESSYCSWDMVAYLDLSQGKCLPMGIAFYLRFKKNLRKLIDIEFNDYLKTSLCGLFFIIRA
jgi:hypothetical protein